MTLEEVAKSLLFKIVIQKIDAKAFLMCKYICTDMSEIKSLYICVCVFGG